MTNDSGILFKFHKTKLIVLGYQINCFVVAHTIIIINLLIKCSGKIANINMLNTLNNPGNCSIINKLLYPSFDIMEPLRCLGTRQFLPKIVSFIVVTACNITSHHTYTIYCMVYLDLIKIMLICLGSVCIGLFYLQLWKLRAGDLMSLPKIIMQITSKG